MTADSRQWAGVNARDNQPETNRVQSLSYGMAYRATTRQFTVAPLSQLVPLGIPEGLAIHAESKTVSVI